MNANERGWEWELMYRTMVSGFHCSLRVPIRTATLPLLLIGALFSGAQQPASFQAAVTRAMTGRPGALVVLNIASGKILAKSHPEIAARRLAAPGSTLKPFVLMELLSLGRVKPGQRLACRRPLYIGGKRMDCTHPEGVNALDAADAIAYSCNSYFASVATLLKHDELARLLRRTGFTSETRLVPNEAVGTLTEAREEAQVQLQVLGEWGIEVTPVELLAAYRNLALQKLSTPDTGSAAPVFDGLERAVRYGMAHAAQPHGTTAAGKTGTAADPGTSWTHGLFVGYAPADKPEIAIVVYLRQGRGLDAAAIAGKVFDAYFRQERD